MHQLAQLSVDHVLLRVRTGENCTAIRLVLGHLVHSTQLTQLSLVRAKLLRKVRWKTGNNSIHLPTRAEEPAALPTS